MNLFRIIQQIKDYFYNFNSWHFIFDAIVGYLFFSFILPVLRKLIWNNCMPLRMICNLFLKNYIYYVKLDLIERNYLQNLKDKLDISKIHYNPKNLKRSIFKLNCLTQPENYLEFLDKLERKNLLCKNPQCNGEWKMGLVYNSPLSVCISYKFFEIMYYVDELYYRRKVKEFLLDNYKISSINFAQLKIPGKTSYEKFIFKVIFVNILYDLKLTQGKAVNGFSWQSPETEFIISELYVSKDKLRNI